MMFSDEAKLTYIPLSSVIVLLIVLLTCASRRKKISAFGALEKNLDEDIKGEYAVMCFPCLKKKPDTNNLDSAVDLTDQFEYIVEKYTIRKVPLLLANTVEDVIERSEELEMTKAENIGDPSTELERNDFVNFQVAEDMYNDQSFMPCITVAANTVCPAKTVGKDRPKPSDILESMSPVTRYPVRNHNYVVIPTRGSLRHKDIMMTKREITTQYLNNFSSVFIDNLKDQIPKDPDQFPNLSRPYTSAFKNYPIASSTQSKSSNKKSKKDKIQRVAYSFPSEEGFGNAEEQYYDSDSSPDRATDVTESEFPENINNGRLEYTSMATIIKEGNTPAQGNEAYEKFFNSERREPCELSSECNEEKSQLNPKNVTYEDIQALDLGYEFSSCEKFGVKPKMTRIHYPYETEKLVETIKQLALGETSKMSKRNSMQDCPLTTNSTRTSIPEKASRFTPKPANASSRNFQLPLSALGNPFLPPFRKSSTKEITETSFLSIPAGPEEKSQHPQTISMEQDHTSTLTFTTRSLCGSKSRSANDLKDHEANAKGLGDSITEISKLYDLTMPISQNYERNPDFEPDSKDFCFPTPSKSRSFQESGRPAPRREPVPGKTPFNSDKNSKRILESETETTTSVISPDSKTSTALTSAMSSETQDCKQATLRPNKKKNKQIIGMEYKMVEIFVQILETLGHRETAVSVDEEKEQKVLSNRDGNLCEISFNERDAANLLPNVNEDLYRLSRIANPSRMEAFLQIYTILIFMIGYILFINETAYVWFLPYSTIHLSQYKYNKNRVRESKDYCNESWKVFEWCMAVTAQLLLPARVLTDKYSLIHGLLSVRKSIDF